MLQFDAGARLTVNYQTLEADEDHWPRTGTRRTLNEANAGEETVTSSTDKSDFLMYLTIGKHRKQTGSTQYVADQNRKNMTCERSEDIHLADQHQIENFV